MNNLPAQIQHVAQQCSKILEAVQPRGGRFADPSTKTQIEYLRQTTQLIQRTRHTKGGLVEVIQSTAHISTFRKRLAALRYFLHDQQQQLFRRLKQPIVPAPEILYLELRQHLEQLQDLAKLQQEGMRNQRAKRRSKRQALAGLPSNWRTALCKRAADGRYIFPLIVLALTGCRPSELVKGIHLWRSRDETEAKDLIHFSIQGVKVKSTQGQPRRTITYAADDPHPLVVVINKLLDTQEEPHVLAKIDSAVNLTVEIRRLANCLWPKHKQPVTAYCFRHQWAADIKANSDEDAASRGLGHISAKTRRFYGTANQASTAQRLRPLRVEAERPLKSNPSFRFPGHKPGDQPRP